MLPQLLLALAPLALAPFQAPKVAPAPSTKALDHVVVIGASLSAGFGDGARPFPQVLAASLHLPPGSEPLGLGDALFFTAPERNGARQIEGALDADATLVVAIDFLFWFGYGASNASGGPITDESQRLELLEKGLGLLAELECPLILGDFPDMTAAVGTMLAPAQMPAKTTLPLLSRRVREWAGARPATVVLPLSELVTRLQAESELTLAGHTFPAGTHLLQADHLHPTLVGQALLARVMGDELVDAKLLPRTALELDFDAILTRLRAPGSQLVPLERVR